MLKELVLKNRSYRRFYEDQKITMDELKELVDVARNTPSGGNKQPIQYKLVCDQERNAKVYECLAWAGYYKDWAGPEPGERPSAYIIIVTPEKTNAMWDEGIAGQTILLSAVEKGMGGCFIGNVDRKKLQEVLQIPAGLQIDLCIALGYPKEHVILEDIPGDGDIKYYRDAESNQHVPKKRLSDILL